ncbi:MAG: lactate racemase domain-containing protein [Anaeromyxobacter sp.]
MPGSGELTLPYGSSPLPFPRDVGARVIRAPTPVAVPDLAAALDAALAAPIGAAPLGAGAQDRVLVIVSDASRDEPRAELYAAVRRALPAVPDHHLTLAIANGTHAPGPPDGLGLPAQALRAHRVVNHDARDEAALVEVGRTARGTRVRVNRCLPEADLVISTGRVKPHYFAGWGGGAKGIFPGLGAEADIRQNHLLKAAPDARLGRADGNPCREDLEEAAALAAPRACLLNVVEVGGAVLGAVAGHPVAAHRAGAALAAPWCEVAASPADVVVVSAPLPVSASLYQASKLVPPGGALLRDGGVLVLCAECPDGVGPLQVVNQGIFALGVRRYLPARYTLFLVSGMPEQVVAQTYARWAPDLAGALERARELVGRPAPDVLVLPDASDLVPRPC